MPVRMEALRTPNLVIMAALVAAISVPAFAAPKTANKAKAGRLLVEGMKQLEAQQLSTAIALFDKATRVDSNSANAFFRLGDAYYRRAFQKGTPESADKDDVHNAIEAYETALGLDPELETIKDPFLLYHGLAQCDEALGRYQDALETIKKAGLLAPQNPMPYLYGAKLRYKMREFEKSSENLLYSVRRARKIKAYPALAKLVRTDPLFVNLLDVPRNRAIFDAYDAVQTGTLSEAEAQGRIDGKTDYRDSLTPARQNVATRPGAAPLRDPVVLKKLDMGNAAFNQQHYRESILEFQSALNEDSRRGTLDPAQRSMIYERIGTCYRGMGLTSEAIRVLTHAVEQQPDNAGAYYQLALSYSANGELNNALAALNQSLSAAQTQPELRKIMLQARTDMEFTPVRDLPKFREILSSHSPKASTPRGPKSGLARR